MGHTEKTTGIVQFNGGNFQNWQFRVEKHLAIAGCLKAICEREEARDGAGDGVLSEEFNKLDLKAQDIITSLISDDYLEYVRDQTTAKGMWDSLCASVYLIKSYECHSR